MNLNKYFDKIFVINLKRRPDRLEKFKKIAETISLEFEVFESFDGKEINRDTLIDGNPIIINSNGLYRGFDGYKNGQIKLIANNLYDKKYCEEFSFVSLETNNQMYDVAVESWKGKLPEWAKLLHGSIVDVVQMDADASKANIQLGWSPKVSLESWIAKHK